MKAIEVIRSLLECDPFGERLFQDMRDAPLTQPTSRGGNHPLWVLGHLAWSEVLLAGMIQGNPKEAYRPDLFSFGTTPTTDPTAYPAYDEVLEQYHQAKAQTLSLLDELGDAGLGRTPVAVMDEMKSLLRTNADVFILIAQHRQFHIGQVADARRAAGRARSVFETAEPRKAS